MNFVISAVLRTGALAAGLIALSACATLDEDQCRTVDWSQLGYDDGQAGRNSSYIDQHRRACERHGLPVSAEQWREGWESGILRYCTPQNGLNEGLAGRSYANSCPAEVRAGFEDAYRVGKRVHDARSERDRLTRELDDLLDKLRREQDPAQLAKLHTEISLKRDSVRHSERRLRDAERDYDYFVFESRVRG
jgi:hypothetical protein